MTKHEEMMKRLHALYIVVEERVALDVQRSVMARIEELQQQVQNQQKEKMDMVCELRKAIDGYLRKGDLDTADCLMKFGETFLGMPPESLDP